MSDIVITDLIQATWDDARRETDATRKTQLERDAATLEDVWRRSRYALAPTREQFQAALGNTTLNLSDTLSAVADGLQRLDARVGEMHTHVQHNDTLVSTFVETFPPQFTIFQAEMRAAAQESSARLKKLEQGQRALNARHGKQIRAIAARMDASDDDRKTLHRAIAAFREEFQQYIAGSKRHEFGQKIEDLERRIKALEARGGG